MRILPLILLLTGVVACFYLAWRPSPFLSEVWWIPHGFASWADGQFNLRTAIPFFGLGLLAVCVATHSNRTLVIYIAALAIVAILLEVGQLFIPERSFHFGDIGFGWLGLGLGVLAGLSIRQVLRWGRGKH